MSIAKTTLSITDIIMNVAAFGKKSLPVAEFVAGFLPGGGVVASAIRIASNAIATIDRFGPGVRNIVVTGTPVIDAIQQQGPDLVRAIKELYAIAINADPERPELSIAAPDVKTEDALEAFAGQNSMFGRTWTNDEYQRWWDKAQGVA